MPRFLALAATLGLLTTPVFAEITIKDAYARSGPKTGAAFFVVENSGASTDRLVSAASDVAQRVELHTHIMEDGIAKMREVEDGFEVPAEGMHMLARGGDHVMFMGLDDPLKTGEVISVTLTFEKAGEIVVEIPVDNDRKAARSGHGMKQGDHSPHKQDDHDHGGHGNHDHNN